VGQRLRALRRAQGLTLPAVEEKSAGRFKATLVGSYERGDRNITVARLAELAEFYGASTWELFPGAVPAAARPQPLILDVHRLDQLDEEQSGPLRRFVNTIIAQRYQHRGLMLSVRADDLRALAVIYELSEAELIERLIQWRVLTTAP